MASSAMWKAQIALHGQSNNAALPAVLVAATSVLVFCEHLTSGDIEVKKFLVGLVVQMVPLVFLQMKILTCPDPLGMLSRFGAKVLLMHACFLALRVCAWSLIEVGHGAVNWIALAVVCMALHKGFNFGCANVAEHFDLCGLVVLAVVGAFFSELLDPVEGVSVLEATVFTSSSYIELLSFVPAIWMVRRAIKKNDDEISTSCTDHVQTQAAFFFAFLIPFYAMEDLISAFHLVNECPLASAGHVVHFLLVADFSCFLLSHIYNPDKVHGSLFHWLPAVSVWV